MLWTGAETDLNLVVDAYFHALFAKYPKSRYTVSWMARISILMSYMPTWIQRKAVNTITMSGAIPAGAVNRAKVKLQ